MATLATNKAWSRIIAPPRKALRELAVRGNRMAWISLIGIPVSLLSSGMAYMLFGNMVGLAVSMVMVFVTSFMAIWSMFIPANNLPADRDISMAVLMVTWTGMSCSERSRRLEQLRRSDVEIDDRILRILEAEHKDLEEVHGGDC